VVICTLLVDAFIVGDADHVPGDWCADVVSDSEVGDSDRPREGVESDVLETCRRATKDAVQESSPLLFMSAGHTADDDTAVTELVAAPIALRGPRIIVPRAARWIEVRLLVNECRPHPLQVNLADETRPSTLP
jgi:hypothetical protein